MKHLFMLTVVDSSQNHTAVSEEFESKRPTVKEIEAVLLKYKAKAIVATLYLGKSKGDSTGPILTSNTVDFLHKGILYKRHPAPQPGSCKGCAFTSIPCGNEYMPNRPRCSGFIFK